MFYSHGGFGRQAQAIDSMRLPSTPVAICPKKILLSFEALTTALSGGGRRGQERWKVCSSVWDEPGIPADQVDGLVEKLITRLGDDGNFFDAVFKQASTNEKTVLVELKDTLKLLIENRGLVVRDVNKIAKFITQVPDGVDPAPIFEKMKELQESQKGIDLQIAETEKQIHLIEKTTVSKTKLKEQYSKVGQIYGRMDKPTQRKIIHALIREIEFKYKKSEETGEIKMGFRGDGEIVEKWFKNINPETLVSRFYVGWLRGTSKNSKIFTLILPIIVYKITKGEREIAIDPTKVQHYLDLPAEALQRLTRRFQYPKLRSSSQPVKVPLDRKALAERYAELMSTGVCRNQADVARHFGVSRAWVTKVMKTIK